MTDCSSELALCKAPFPVVRWRILNSSGRLATPAAYLDARDVMDRLDFVYPNQWSTRYENLKITDKYIVVCYLTINGVTRADGAGDTNIESEKGAISDAFKRAAVHFGIGRYLYDLNAPDVEPEVRGSKKHLSADTVAYLNDWYAVNVLGVEKTVSEDPPKGYSMMELKGWLRGLDAEANFTDMYDVVDWLEDPQTKKRVLAIHDELGEQWFCSLLRFLDTQCHAKGLDMGEILTYIEQTYGLACPPNYKDM